MARSHTHQEGGPVCKYPTKKECDDNWRTLLKERKLAFEEAERAKAEQAKTERIKRFDAFIAKEAERMRQSAKTRPIRTIRIPKRDPDARRRLLQAVEEEQPGVPGAPEPTT